MCERSHLSASPDISILHLAIMFLRWFLSIATLNKCTKNGTISDSFRELSDVNWKKMQIKRYDWKRYGFGLEIKLKLPDYVSSWYNNVYI